MTRNSHQTSITNKNNNSDRAYLSWSRPKTSEPNRYLALDQLDFQDTVRLKAKAWLFSVRNVSAYRKSNHNEVDTSLVEDNNTSSQNYKSVNSEVVHQSDSAMLEMSDQDKHVEIADLTLRSESFDLFESENHYESKDLNSTENQSLPEEISLVSDNELYFETEFNPDLDLTDQEDVEILENDLIKINKEQISRAEHFIVSEYVEDLIEDDQGAGTELQNVETRDEQAKAVKKTTKETLQDKEVETVEGKYVIEKSIFYMNSATEIIKDKGQEDFDAKESSKSIIHHNQIESIWDDLVLEKETNEKKEDRVDIVGGTQYIKHNNTAYRANLEGAKTRNSISFFNNQDLENITEDRNHKAIYTPDDDQGHHGVLASSKDMIANKPSNRHNNKAQDDYGSILDPEQDNKWWWDKTGSVDYLVDIDYDDISNSVQDTKTEAISSPVNDFDISGLAKKERQFSLISILKKIVLIAVVVIGSWLIFFRSNYKDQINMISNVIPILGPKVDIVTSSGSVIKTAKVQERLVARVKYKKQYNGIININYINRNTDKYLIKNLNMRVNGERITPIYLPIAKDSGMYILSIVIDGKKIDQQITIE